MANETEQRIVYIRVDSQAAIEGSRAYTSALEKMEKAQAAAGASLNRVEQSINRVGGYLKAQLAIMAAEAGSRLVQMGKDAFEAASGLDELAQQLGITARGLQGIQYQATQNGVKLEQLETGLAKFSQKMGEAADGSKEMVEALNALGVKNLDVQGKLRPTETLLQEVAAAIVAIEDPAKRSAAAVDFFGKAGARMLPLLAEMAKGSDSMAAAAQRAGAMISDETIAKLDKLADSFERAKLKNRAAFAEMLADAIDWSDKFLDKIGANPTEAQVAKRRASLVQPIEDFFDWLGDTANQMTATGARFAAQFLESLAGIPGGLKNLFVRGMDSALEALETGLNKINSGFANSWLGRQIGATGAPVNLGRIGGGIPNADYLANRNAEIEAAGQRAYDATLLPGSNAERRERQRFIDRQAAMASDEDKARAGKLGPAVGRGASTSAIKGAGGAEAEAIAKRRRETELETEAQLAYADASEKGARAVADLEVHFKALKAAQDAYGKTADSNKAGVAKLTDELERLMKTAEKARNLKEFNLGTEELERNNKILAAENALINASAEERGRVIALIKVQNEVEAKGLDLNDEKTRQAVERRREATEMGETLKAQGEQLKQAQELWTEPLKRALQDIQSTAADAFEAMLESGKFNFEELGRVFKRIVIRMAAEFLALATVRPIMTVAVNAATGAGILSPAQGQALGAGGNYGGGGMGLGGFGGGGLSSMFSGGGSGWFGDFGRWLNTPFIGGAGSTVPAGMGAGLEGSAIAGMAPGLTPLGAIGGAASIGMGAYNLFTSKSIGGKIGGGLGILGGGLGLAAALIPGMAALGPLGLGVGLLGAFLPGLLGGGEEKKPPKLMATGGLNFNAGKWNYNGSEYNGGQGLGGTLGSVGGTMKSLMDAAGVTSLTSNNSLNYQTLSKGEFSSATTFVNGTQWGQGSGADAGLDTAAAHIAHMIMMEVGSGISDVMRRGLGNYGQQNLEHAFSTQELGQAVTELKAFDDAIKNIGKTTTGAETALKAIDDSFKGLLDTAKKYDLDSTAIDADKIKQRTKVATDFAEGLQRQYDDLTGNTAKGQLADIKKAYDDAIANNKYLVENVKGSTDQILLIEKLFGEQRAKVATDMWQQVPELARGQNLFTQRQALGESLRAYNDDTAAIGANPMATQIKGWNREAGLMAKGVGDTFGIGSQEYYDATMAGARRLAAQMKAANDNFAAGLEAMTRELEGAGVANIKNLMDARGKDLATAAALDGPFFDGILRVGENVAKAMKAWNAKIFRVADDFKYSISQGLLAFTDPLQAQLNDLNKQREEALATAKANNAAVEKIAQEQVDRIEALDKMRANDLYAIKYTQTEATRAGRALTEAEAEHIAQWQAEADLAKSVSEQVGASLGDIGAHYVSMLDVAALYTKKEEQLRKQFYQQAVTGLEALIKRITYGDLSGASSITQFTGAQASYSAVRAQAFAGDQTALNNFAGAAGDFLTTARDFFAYTPEYFALLEQIKRDAQELNTTLSAGNTPSGTAALSPDMKALADALQRSLAANDDKQRTIDRLVVELGNTNSLLQRFVANGR